MRYRCVLFADGHVEDIPLAAENRIRSGGLFGEGCVYQETHRDLDAGVIGGRRTAVPAKTHPARFEDPRAIGFQTHARSQRDKDLRQLRWSTPSQRIPRRFENITHIFHPRTSPCLPLRFFAPSRLCGERSTPHLRLRRKESLRRCAPLITSEPCICVPPCRRFGSPAPQNDLPHTRRRWPVRVPPPA